MGAGVTEPRLGNAGSVSAGTDIGGRVDGTGGQEGEAGSTRSPTPAGIDDFYRAHYESLVRLAFLLTLSEEVARDLVQDVFVRVYGRFDGLDEPLVNAGRKREHL